MDTAETATPPTPVVAPNRPQSAPPGGLRYWRRCMILAGVVAVLLVLSWWDGSRLPDEPVAPSGVAITPLPGTPRD